MKAIMEGTDFIHGEGLIGPDEIWFWYPPGVGPQWVGSASLTATDTHHDGGFTSAGLVGLTGSTMFGVDLAVRDEPDASWAATFQSCSWTDCAGAYNAVRK